MCRGFCSSSVFAIALTLCMHSTSGAQHLSPCYRLWQLDCPAGEVRTCDTSKCVIWYINPQNPDDRTRVHHNGWDTTLDCEHATKETSTNVENIPHAAPLIEGLGKTGMESIGDVVCTRVIRCFCDSELGDTIDSPCRFEDGFDTYSISIDYIFGPHCERTPPSPTPGPGSGA